MPECRLPPARRPKHAEFMHRSPSTTHPRTLPPVGPAWFGSLMGTSILCTLAQIHSGDTGGRLHLLAVLLLPVVAGLLLVLVVGSVRRWRQVPGAAAMTVRTPGEAAQWGMVAMGLLAAGSAVSTVWPRVHPATADVAWGIDGVLWVLGTGIGLATAVLVPLRMRHAQTAPSLILGLAVVPPMVSATAGLGLATRVSGGWQLLLMVVIAVCFGLALILGIRVFAAAIAHALRVEPVPVQAACSTWLPLGIIGQSSAAAVLFAAQAAPLVGPGMSPVIDSAARVYATGVLLVGAVVVTWALVTTARGLRRGMRFAPGWWALTFPVGTVSLGAHHLAAHGGAAVFESVSRGAFVMLVCTWTLCAVASLWAIAQVRRVPARAPRGGLRSSRALARSGH